MNEVAVVLEAYVDRMGRRDGGEGMGRMGGGEGRVVVLLLWMLDI